LTRGKPSVTNIVELSGIGETELHRLIAIAASGSQDPLGHAVIVMLKKKA
jgi:cation transport ATPase